MRFDLGGALYTAAYGLSTAAESRPMEISQDGVWMQEGTSLRIF
jgi:hypothetical protein